MSAEPRQDPPVDTDFRDYTPLWHAKVLAVAAIVVAAALVLAMKTFL